MTLDRKLKRREGLRAFLKSTMENIEKYLKGDDISEAKLRSFKSMLDSTCAQLSDINEEILPLLDPEKISDDVVQSMGLMLPATEIDACLDIKLLEIAKSNGSASVSLPTASVSSGASVSRLPKIELPTFKGDPLKWQGFWDQFKISIHENERKNDIDRFNFLKKYLTGEALDSIKGSFGSSIWTLDLLLTYLNEELRAQENCTNSGGGKAERTDESDPLYSALGLFSNTEKNVCVFCKKSHSSAKCRKVTNTQSRRDILIREKRCFVCLARGHRSNACRDKYSCNRCNKRHHISICDEVEALCVPDICSPIANQKLDCAKKLIEFSDLVFADVSEEFDLSIGVLVGIDFYFRFFTGKRRESKEGVVACESSLGWILSGSVVFKGLTEVTYSHQMRVEVQTVDPLDAKLHKFWQIEEAESAEDNSVINQFTKDIYHDGTRYVAKLPFKPDHESVPDNFSTCVKRLESLNSRLDRLGINTDYEKIFIDYEKDGIIERVPEAQIAKEEGTVHYIPHRPVIREDKVTTKIRPVFDASCSVNGVSLNDCLYPGPNLLAKIFDILLRFRMNKIGILADIKQAFLNICIHPDHRDFLRFLWKDPSSSDREVVVYRFF
ncbi:uncharacterized protein [Clytia hemisphaerica]|uniref:uncharacterized protein n=1 Tax=Clytia hemisphaerica TaxID=252671 RepID=UPI0034D669F5